MKRVGMTWRVHPEHLEPYTDIHLNPWPELLEAIQAVGIHNYNIFALGNRMFAYLEVDGDIDEALGNAGRDRCLQTLGGRGQSLGDASSRRRWG